MYPIRLVPDRKCLNCVPVAKGDVVAGILLKSERITAPKKGDPQTVPLHFLVGVG